MSIFYTCLKPFSKVWLHSIQRFFIDLFNPITNIGFQRIEDRWKNPVSEVHLHTSVILINKRDVWFQQDGAVAHMVRGPFCVL